LGEEVLVMTHDNFAVSLPHHRLHVWQLALELVRLVRSVEIGDADNRAQAREAASSCARNIAEGAGRQSRRDKARVYGIARGEAVECVAAVEIAGALGACAAADVARVVTLGGRVSAMLSRLT
jgi:four helix bundle protein